MKEKKLYVTYTRDVNVFGREKQRFAVGCSNEDELMKEAMDLSSQASVSNVRLNRSGKLAPGTIILQ